MLAGADEPVGVRRRIGYFGGSFDPSHHGHLTVAREVRDRLRLDEVLLAPTGRQPLKPHGPAAPFEDRLCMTTLLCAGERGLKASDVDKPRADGEPNYTVDTLRRLKEQLPEQTEIFAIVGADALLSLPQWRGVAELFTLAEWAVVSRPGFALKAVEQLALTAAQRARLHLVEGISDPTSATHLRASLRDGSPCEDLLPPQVLRYIRAHRLYGVGAGSMPEPTRT